LQQIDRTYVLFRGQKLSYFAGCDYFRLGSEPRVLSSMREAVETWGLNVAASRLTTGNHVLYGRLEEALARFFGAQSALVVSTGYVSNLVVCQGLAGNFSHALIDRRAHPSLTDGARLLDCPVLQFEHRQPGDVARCVRRCGKGAKLALLTDGMFSHDGAVAPLREYLKVLPQDALILADDAHGAGVLGNSGRGTLEHAGVSRQRVVQTVTLSKAFGVFGGAVLCSKPLRQTLLERSHLFAGSTPMPLALAQAALTAAKLLAAGSKLRQRLRANADYVKQGLRAAGFALADKPGPIVSLVAPDEKGARKLKRALIQQRIFPPHIRYPGGPVNGYFRFVFSSEHSREQLGGLLKVLGQFASWSTAP
jgi:7-keto-8-aminopelargonate synthetase-like enzyme